MNTTAAVVSATLIALSAIVGATIAVVQGSIDGSSFSAIIGAAIGVSGGGAGAVIVHAAANGRLSREEKK